MTQAILALLPSHLAQAHTAQDARVSRLVGVLPDNAISGMRAGIAGEPRPARQPGSAVGAPPESRFENSWPALGS